MHAIANVLCCTVLLRPLVKIHQVYFLVHRPRLATLVCLFIGDDLTAVGIDELTFLEVLHGPKAPSTVFCLEDLKQNRPAMLNDPILAIAFAIAKVVAFVDVMAVLKVEASEAAEVGFAGRVWEHPPPLCIQGGVIKAFA